MSQGYGRPTHRVPAHDDHGAGQSEHWATNPNASLPSASWHGGHPAEDSGGGYRQQGYQPPDGPGDSFQGPTPPAQWAESNGYTSGHSGRSMAEIREEEAVHGQVRNAAISRIQFLNSNHAQHAWELRRRRPIGPHALAFLYAVQDFRVSGARPFYEARAASRRFRDGDDVQDVVKLLAEMSEIARDYETAGHIFDPLTHMTQRTDEVPPGATYIGLGVSTLDTPAGTWRDIQARITSPLQIPGRCLVALTDGTRMLIDRPGELHLPLLLYANRSLASQFGLEYRSWRPLTEDQQADPVWMWMDHLNQKVIDGQVRMAAARRRTRR